MHRIRILLLVVVTTLALGLLPTAAASAEPPGRADLEAEILALPGVVSVDEGNAPLGYRFFVIGFEQPVDHHDPAGPTFVQQLSLLHRDEDRPTVLYTSGYYGSTRAFRSEPTRLVDGNQLTLEHRFFEPSRPEDPDWERQLTIWQSASDQHRVIDSFRGLYADHWLTTGASKGGMTATYHRRFFPEDVDGTIAYVAPNDRDNDRDSYNRFLARVGTERCRDAITAVQRRILGPDRSWFRHRTRDEARKQSMQARILGGFDRAMEVAVVDLYFTFWQYTGRRGCSGVPRADASRREVWRWTQWILPLTGYLDPRLRLYRPYYHQAATQLGWPEPRERPLRRVVRHPGGFAAPHFLPKRMRDVTFDDTAMRDVDRWVRNDATQILFVYGGVDPWGAERFSCGAQVDPARQCEVRTVRGGTHGVGIRALAPVPREEATALVRAWAGLPAGSRPAPRDATLDGDERDLRPRAGLR